MRISYRAYEGKGREGGGAPQSDILGILRNTEEFGGLSVLRAARTERNVRIVGEIDIITSRIQISRIVILGNQRCGRLRGRIYRTWILTGTGIRYCRIRGIGGGGGGIRVFVRRWTIGLVFAVPALLCLLT